MKLGIVIYSTDSETVWNAFRLGNFSLKKGDNNSCIKIRKCLKCYILDDYIAQISVL